MERGRRDGGLSALFIASAMLVFAPVWHARAQAPPAPSAAPAAILAAPSTPPPPPSAPNPPAPAFDLPGAERTLKAIEAQEPAAVHGPEIDALHERALALESEAGAASVAANAEVGQVDTRLKRFEPPKRAADETPGERETRHKLRLERLQLERRAKAVSLVAAGAQQAADKLADQRRALFNNRWLQRTASPLSPELWTGLGETLPRDQSRLVALAVEAERTFVHAPEPRTGWVLALAALAAGLVVGPLRGWLKAAGRRRVAAEAPTSALRRSGYAVWMILAGTGTTAIAALGVQYAARWTGALSPRADAMAHTIVVATIWTSFAIQLGATVLAVNYPAWRLSSLSDAAARRFRPYVSVAALVTGAGLLVVRLNSVIGASLAATVAADFIVTLLDIGVAGAALIALARGRTALDPNDADAAARSSVWTLVAVALTIAIMTALFAATFGYTALAARIATGIVWVAVLAVAAWVASEFLGDAAETLLAPSGRIGRALFLVFGLRTATIGQLSVLASAAMRLLVWGGAVTMALSPFGVGGSIVGHFHGFDDTLRLGQVSISPGALVGGVLALVVGVTVVRAVRRWFDTRYLPATDWDPGVQNSVSTALSYLGVTLAVLWALASAGLGLQRVALIASALSVGIGFGLQQVVQNFVSGLILLLERPVKVGDWVSVGGIEGDISHIRVRATEIQTFDRSTLLVPNSELITKVVQNKTLGAPLGRIQLQLSIADPHQAGPARELIRAGFAAHAAVLNEPEPKVFVDGVTAGAVSLNGFAYVASPRDAYGVRSDLYLDVLERLRDASIALGGATQTLTLDPSLDLAALLERAPANPESPTMHARPPVPAT